MLCQCPLGPANCAADLLARLIDVLGRKSIIGLEPFLAFGRNRDLCQSLFEFLRTLFAQDRPDALRPANGRDRMKQMLVDDLAPPSHARAPERACRLERRIGKCIVEIFVHHRRLGDDLAIMNERRYLSVGVDSKIFSLEMIAVGQTQKVALICQSFFLERQADLDGSLCETGVAEFEHPNYGLST